MKLYKVFFTLVRKQSSKILASVLQVKPANTIISPPFLTKRTEMVTCRKRAFCRSVWRLNVCRAVPPEYLSSQFIKRTEVSNRRTRNSQKLNLTLFETASGQRTFYYRTLSLWNSLDPSLKLCRNVELLK